MSLLRGGPRSNGPPVTAKELSKRLSFLFNALAVVTILGVMTIVGYTLWTVIANPAPGLQTQITQINNSLTQVNNSLTNITNAFTSINVTELLLIQETLAGLNGTAIAQLFITVNNLQITVNELLVNQSSLDIRVTALEANETSLINRVTVLETNATQQQSQIDGLNSIVSTLAATLAACNCSGTVTPPTTELPWGAPSPPILMTTLNKITAASFGTCFGVSRPTGGPFWEVTGTCSFTFVQDDVALSACSGQIIVVPTYGAPLNLVSQPGAQGAITFFNPRTSTSVIGVFFPDTPPSTLVVAFTFDATSQVGDTWTSNTVNILP